MAGVPRELQHRPADIAGNPEGKQRGERQRREGNGENFSLQFARRGELRTEGTLEGDGDGRRTDEPLALEERDVFLAGRFDRLDLNGVPSIHGGRGRRNSSGGLRQRGGEQAGSVRALGGNQRDRAMRRIANLLAKLVIDRER